MGKRVVICGAAGFVGSKLVPELLARDWDVTSVDLGWFGDHLPDTCEKRWMSASDLTAKDLTGVDVVIWLGGVSNDPMAGYKPHANYVQNAAHPAYLCYLSRQAGVKRFIHGGSCSVYGNSPHHLQYEDDATPTPQFPYGIAKLQAEVGCLPLVSPDFSVIGLRKGTVCGYSPRMRFDLIVNTMVKDALLHGVITVNNAAISRPILAIQDAVIAYARAAECDQRISGIFNVAGPNMAVGDVAAAVREALAQYGLKTEIKLLNVADARDYRVSCEKAERVLGWQPRVIEIGSIVDDIMARRAEYGDMTQSNYYNIQRFKEIVTV